MSNTTNLLLLLFTLFVVPATAGETLYNGVVLPDEWPPRPESFPRDNPVTPPWLAKAPDVVPIDVGRQLFVDDFLIADTTLRRTFHQPEYHPDCPVLKPEKPWEIRRDTGFAAPFSDGVWYDPRDRKFKMWYMAGTIAFFGYAESEDGVQWQRPELNTTRYGDNVLNIEPIQRDSSTVWLDLDDKNPARRFKMVYYRSGLITRFSPDGIAWSDPVVTHRTGDRTTLFYNPFRKVWVYSVRSGRRNVGRCRYYGETRDLSKKAFQNTADLARWTCADSLDRVRGGEFEGDLPDLYNLDAAPYESLMLGFFAIHSQVARGDRPKINHVTLGYSRDGFHWHRPDRRAFLNVSEDKDAWNYGNVQSAGGGCVVMGDKLYFYCSGRNSRKTQDDGSGGSTGLAILRRDGFASMDATDEDGALTTRPVVFSGKHLFVNVDCPQGRLQVEILDRSGRPIAPFTRENCSAVRADKTLARVVWKGAADVSRLAGKTVQFRFHLENGRFYSFWVSPDKSGASYGYVAAGGPGFPGHRDTVGDAAFNEVGK